DRGEDEQLGNASIGDQVALRDRQRVADQRERDRAVASDVGGGGDDGGTHAAPREDRDEWGEGSSSVADSARWPVRVRNTSSMLGSRTTSVTGSRCSISSARRTSTSACAP